MNNIVSTSMLYGQHPASMFIRWFIDTLKQYGASLLFSLLSLFFLSLFFLICFVFQVYGKESFYWISWTPKWIHTTYYFRRERGERVAEVQSWGDGRVVRWCWVNFQCQGVLLIWIIMSKARAYCACSRCGWLFGHFFSLVCLFFLPLWQTAYRLKYSFKGLLNPKQLTNQIQSLVVWEHQSIAITITFRTKCVSKYRQWSDYSFYNSGFKFTTLCCCMKFAEQRSRW